MVTGDVLLMPGRLLTSLRCRCRTGKLAESASHSLGQKSLPLLLRSEHGLLNIVQGMWVVHGLLKVPLVAGIAVSDLVLAALPTVLEGTCPPVQQRAAAAQVVGGRRVAQAHLKPQPNTNCE